MKIKTLLLLFSLFSFLLLFLVILPSAVIDHRLGSFSLDSAAFVPVSSSQVFRQEFTNPQGELARVSIFLKNPGLLNQSQYTLDVLSSTGDIIRSLSFSGANAADPGWLNFDFPPISDSSDTRFSLRLSADTSSNPPLYIGLNPATSTLAYQAYYSQPDFYASLADTITRLSISLSKIHRSWLIAYLGLILGLAIYLIYLSTYHDN